MWQLRRLGAPSISPDGKLAVLAVTRYELAENRGYSDLWVISTDGGRARALTEDPASDSQPRVSPDGQWIAFISKRDDDTTSQLYVIAIDGGKPRRVTNIPTGVSAHKWFPDSRRLAFVSYVWPQESWERIRERLKPRSPTQSRAMAWERTGVCGMGLHRDVAQLPRLERLRSNFRGLTQSGHDARGPVSCRQTVCGSRTHGSRGSQLRRLPDRGDTRHEHPFKALVAHAPEYNSYMQYSADLYAQMPRSFHHWERPELFARYSPHTYAGNFKTPTLVSHGQLDRQVPVNHGFELFNTLQARGGPSKLIYFPDENHWIEQPQNLVFWYDATREWLDRYVGADGVVSNYSSCNSF